MHAHGWPWPPVNSRAQQRATVVNSPQEPLGVRSVIMQPPQTAASMCHLSSRFRQYYATYVAAVDLPSLNSFASQRARRRELMARGLCLLKFISQIYLLFSSIFFLIINQTIIECFVITAVALGGVRQSFGSASAATWGRRVMWHYIRGSDRAVF